MKKDYPRINDITITSMPVIDSSEVLVSVLGLNRVYLLSQTNLEFKTIDGDSSNPIIRQSIKTQLEKVIEKLDTKYGILFIEGYRRYDYQKALFQDRVAEIIKNDKVSITKAKIKASQFVSDPDIYSPHVTGGAIDLGILHLESMELLDMGNNFTYDDSAMLYHPNLTKDQKQNRQMLVDLMTGAGFVNYPYEWWHWSYGDKYWAYVSDKSKAIYDSVI